VVYIKTSGKKPAKGKFDLFGNLNGFEPSVLNLRFVQKSP